jgi:hypothetical protein
MSHTFTVPPLSVRVWGNRCATLEQEMLLLAGSVDGQYLCGEQDGRRQDKVQVNNGKRGCLSIETTCLVDETLFAGVTESQWTLSCLFAGFDRNRRICTLLPIGAATCNSRQGSYALG